MTVTFAEIRSLIAARIREYLSDEQNRRDATSAVSSLMTFLVFLFIASSGMMPSYLFIDRPGRAMTIHVTMAPDVAVAELAQTRLRESKPAPQPSPAQPAPSERPYRLETLSSMAASRPEYFGRQPILPPVRQDRPVVSDAPERWQDKPAPEQQPSERAVYGSSQVAMPSPKLGTATGAGEPTSEVSFDVPVAGTTKGADFITLSSQARPSSVGQPGGREMSTRRPILRKPMPTIPEWFERKGLDSFVTLRVLISASGKVESADVEKTSGFKELDADARTSVLEWVFAPTGVRESLVVKFNYRLR